MTEITMESQSAEKLSTGKRVLFWFVILLNAYAGGCVTAEIGPFESLQLLASNPADVLSFLMNGLGFYLGPVLIILLYQL